MRRTVTIGSLFSGIGGLELGLECALRDGGFDVDTVFQCEADAWCRSILAHHWPSALRFDDVRAVGAHNAPRCDVLCGGFPCQDVSYAGKGAGLAGERSGLWFEFARVVRELRPRVVVVENVAALAHRGLDAVLGSLSEAGYDAVWFDVRASDVGAPHRRERLFIVAWHVADGESKRRRPHGQRRRGSLADAGVGGEDVADPAFMLLGVGDDHARSAGDGGGAIPEHRKRSRDRRGANGGRGGAQPGLGGDADGLPRGLDLAAHRWPVGPDEAQPEGEPPRVAKGVPMRRQRIGALGNAVVPQVGYVVGCVVARALAERWGE